MNALAAVATIEDPRCFPAGCPPVEDWIGRMEATLDVLRLFPPGTKLASVSGFSVSVWYETFDEIFAGCEVLQSRTTRWAWCNGIKVEAQHFEHEDEEEKRVRRVRIPEVMPCQI